MKTKEKFEKALEQLTQLRIELLKIGNERIEEKVSEIEMTICEGIDLFNNVGLADNMLCGSFDPDNITSSATKCKCGREKWEHTKPRNES